MSIISSYFKGESYGLLGPQMAATIIQDNTQYDCIVIVVTRDDDKALIKKALKDYFGKEKPIIGFSTLSGREDLFSFAKNLREEGVTTLLAGPQAGSDYLGERDWDSHPYRFHGLSACFTYSLHGPAEQAINFLKGLDTKYLDNIPGLLFYKGDHLIENYPKPWDEAYLRKVRWDNIYRISESGFVPINIKTGQVLQQIGCPHATRENWIALDYPSTVKGRQGETIKISLRGCSFCDVAIDKGFFGALDLDTVMSQIQCLPEDGDGRKIPFELINENPLFHLPHLLKEVSKRKIRLSQINLILRADWFLRGEKYLRESLNIANSVGLHILLSSMGFEAFDDRLLQNFNKGLNVKTNIEAIRLMRRLKEDYPDVWGYSREEGSIHGFIYPTPWDTKETYANTQKNIAVYGLSRDILPPHSTPLIIHHGSALGDWIREVEKQEGIQYKRYGSVIGWWEEQNIDNQ